MKRMILALAVLLGGLAMPAVAAELGDDGLHKEDWMRETFLDLREDLAEAGAEGKRMALMIEQRGCIYCKKMHEEVYPQEDIAAYIRENYFVVQLNLHGDREVTDLDGESMSEKDLLRKWGILFTPTVIYLPEEVEEDKSAKDAAVAIMPGAFSKSTALDMYVWVNEKRYEMENGEDFQRYHARRIKERQAGQDQ
ncbi:MAG: thioredoxin family protein [Roseovarius pacificus]|nr:thioredoxin family protein [Roseovarius pacificus]